MVVVVVESWVFCVVGVVVNLARCFVVLLYLFLVFVHRFIVDDSIDADIMAEKEQEFIGLVIDIDASVNQVTDDLLNVVRTFHEEHQEAQTMKYPL